MASTGITGRGVTFELRTDGSPDDWIKIANVSSINLTGLTVEEIDFTNLDSEDSYRELRAGFKDPGTVGIDYQFTPQEESHVELLALFNSGEMFDWRINYTGAKPTGLPWYREGRGFVQNPGDLSHTVNDPVGGSATVRVSGKTELKSATP